MQEKAFTLHNKGMNRDLSISKAGESAAYENHNIRIIARDNDTALSVTNERGNREISFNEDLAIVGSLIGWNVLDSHIILFTHDDVSGDYIYRVDYHPENKDSEDPEFEITQLFSGDLKFDLEHPIESIVYHETDLIQKIYWIDGKNPLRFLNFMADDDERANWDADGSDFESNKAIHYTVTAEVNKDQSGNSRPNGVIQYILTYYNLHGQESGYAWMSDIIYLAPAGHGGSADGNNNTRVEIRLRNLDTSFTNYRVYSVFRSSYDGATVSYIVDDGEIPANTLTEDVIVVDDYANQTAEDSNRVLYLGSQPVIAGTMTHKDQTLFLGDLKSVGRGEFYEDLERLIAENMRDPETGIIRNGCLVFAYQGDIPLPNNDELYPYQNQLEMSSSNIKTFKGGEKYRFAFVFRFKDGTSTDAFWIGDAINKLYPEMDEANHVIKRVIAQCIIPSEVLNYLTQNTGLETIQLMIAEASYADRLVKAQGILNPTVFNVWDRYNDRVFAQASWITRPRNSGFANRHFDVVKASTSSYGEIDCNYWVNTTPTPYYRMKDYDSTPVYNEEFDGISDYDYVMVVVGVATSGVKSINKDHYAPSVSAVKIKMIDETAASSVLQTPFDTEPFSSLLKEAGDNGFAQETFKDYQTQAPIFTITIYDSGVHRSEGYGDASKDSAYAFVRDYLSNTANLSSEDIIGETEFGQFCDDVHDIWAEPLIPSGTTWGYINDQFPGEIMDDWSEAFDYYPDSADERWKVAGYLLASSNSDDYAPSYYKKHLMFVDENIVTLNSPEIEQGVVSIDNVQGLKLRIVGVAKVTSSEGDYTVDATPGKLPGENLITDRFSSQGGSGNIDSLISWPLWNEYGLIERTKNPDGSDYTEYKDSKDDRVSYDYIWGSSKVAYWLHMWNHAGKINGFTDVEGSDYSRLNSKVFANLRIAAKTVYNIWDNSVAGGNGFNCYYTLGNSSLRTFNYTSSQYVGINSYGKTRYYDGIIKSSLFPPGNHKYPILYSLGIADTAREINSSNYELTSSTPVPIEYYSSPHAIISFPTWQDGTYYYEEILPRLNTESTTNIERAPTLKITGALLPWIDNYTGTGVYPYVDSVVSQKVFTPRETISASDRYLFIGELYRDADKNVDYGGIKPSDIERNRFVVAGPQYVISDIVNSGGYIYANQGDTYFQRWDCLKTKPFNGSVNGVIDITSVMLETHINIDGRTDQQRGITQLASIDTENFGVINPVYSQPDNFYQRRDLGEDFNLDSYRSSITWTLQKSDSADIDEWTHITLASTLKLDGDAGICRALRRFQNSIIAFQDKGISEVLFNSRTQLSTTDGVPVELANSGKVDGKRYISNRFGCVNKWSIVEGKTGLYFVDNINKAFCAFNGGVDSISDKLGFGVWFKDINDVSPWTPKDFNNVVSFYDREFSDVYLVRKSDDEMPCLVYNENLQAFTSFFDYNEVPMITNVRDRLISFRNSKLWLQNEGLYCNFFNQQYDFWTQYRVTPEPFSDKLFTNFDYRADFYHILDANGTPQVPEEYLVNGDMYGSNNDLYKEYETFTDYKVWNEYQTTDVVPITANTAKWELARKKFRIWRVAIARAIRKGTNVRGLDRIRNPWINLQLRKDMSDDNNQYLAQLHDIVVRYFE